MSEKETPQAVRLVVGEQVTHHLVRGGWLAALGIVLQLVLIGYLAFGQPVSKIDARFLTAMDRLLDADARIGRMEREQTMLFRMLGSGNDQQGLMPGPTVPLWPPMPEPAPKRIGDTPNNLIGDVPEM